MNKTALVFVAMLAVFAGIKASAQIVPNRVINFLPPKEYDHQYEGDLTIKIVDTQEELYALCATDKLYALGCAYPGEKSCIIIMVKDEVMRKKGWTTGLLFRHEQGHCNKWLGTHPGVRPLDKDTYWVSPSERVKIPQDRLDKAERVRAGAPR